MSVVNSIAFLVSGKFEKANLNLLYNLSKKTLEK